MLTCKCKVHEGIAHCTMHSNHVIEKIMLKLLYYCAKLLHLSHNAIISQHSSSSGCSANMFVNTMVAKSLAIICSIKE